MTDPMSEHRKPSIRTALDQYSTKKKIVNANYQGNVRTVQNARLIYKRKQPNGTYEELWLFNVSSDPKINAKIKKDILTITNIDDTDERRISPDGGQTHETSVIGNIAYVKVSGITK